MQRSSTANLIKDTVEATRTIADPDRAGEANSERLHRNFADVRIHSKLRMTPAMVAGVTDRLWSLDELVEMSTSAA